MYFLEGNRMYTKYKNNHIFIDSYLSAAKALVLVIRCQPRNRQMCRILDAFSTSASQ